MPKSMQILVSTLLKEVCLTISLVEKKKLDFWVFCLRMLRLMRRDLLTSYSLQCLFFMYSV